MNSFVWGAATAAFQVEGAAAEDGRGPSIWDAFCRIPGKIRNNDNADIACDQYHRYREDIELLQQLGANAYRFSFSWPRILPDGKGEVNAKGLDHYDRLIDCLLEHGIDPWVTLYHWDLPLALQMENDGWLNRRTAEAFGRYAGICFDRFGDRVKHWITLNEPWCSAVLGHGIGMFAPGRSDADEPYVAAHNLLLAHAFAVREFRSRNQGGMIGISNNCDWREPATDRPEDREAAERALEFFYAWFTDPLVFGEYPRRMRDRLGRRLPEFSDADRMLVQGSCDFLGLNHYSTAYASAATEPVAVNIAGNGGMSDDQEVALTEDPAWEKTDMEWNIVPWGFRKMLEWIGDRYPGLPIYVTENGCACPDATRDEAVHDDQRCRFLTGYIAAMQEAKAPVRGYFVWSLLDNFEWCQGYSKRLGLVHCDYATLERTPKQSFHVYRDLIRAARNR